MAKLIIDGGVPLNGETTPSGNKNAALPLLAASLLTDERIVLRNVPHIRDVLSMAQILEALGVEVEALGQNEFALRAREVRSTQLDPVLCQEIRASILFAGPMLTRCQAIVLPPPGGDVIGRRRVDTHIQSLRALGATVQCNGGYEMRTNGLRGAPIFLDEPSVTGTENAIMAASMAKGTTILRNAASEPHVQELARFLNAMGAQIEGIGSNQLVIHGVDKLHGTEWRIGPDHIEVGSFVGLAAVTRSELTIGDVEPLHLRSIRLMFERLGVYCEIDGRTLRVPAEQSLEICMDVGRQIPKIDDGPWPLFPADLISIALVVATQCRGTILIHEKMFESRMFFADKLSAMGARIVLCDPHRAVVVGPAKLHGSVVESPDIRAGMAILIAALGAEGRSEIHNIKQIERGYERIDERLRQLGAAIERFE